MAFNLGNKFEIHSLRRDVSEIQNQLSKLQAAIPATYVTVFNSWKHPADSAYALPVSSILNGCNFCENNLEACQTAHVVLLELAVDRLVAFLQSLGTTLENVLRSNGELSDTTSDLAKKTCIGIIVKRLTRLLENTISVWRARSRKMEEKNQETAEQTDNEEIKLRNVCVDCESRRSIILLYSAAVSQAFSIPPISEEFSKSDLEKYQQLVMKKSQDFRAMKISTKEMRTKLNNLNVQYESRLLEGQSLSQNEQVSQGKITAEKSSVALARDEQNSDNESLRKTEQKLTALRETVRQQEVDNDCLRKTIQEKLHQEELLKNKIRESEKQLDVMDFESGKEAEALANENKELKVRCEAAKFRLMEFEGFDCDWTVKHAKLADTVGHFRGKWQRCEATLDEQQKLIDQCTDEVTAAEAENQRLIDLITKARLEKAERERHPPREPISEKPPDVSASGEPDLKLLVSGEIASCQSGAGDNIQTNERGSSHIFSVSTKTCPVDEFSEIMKHISPINPDQENMNTDFKALFADFLELPDVQNMPEWDLVSDVPRKSSLPDFGISDCELEVRRVSTVASKHSLSSVNKPSNSSRKTPLASPTKLKFCTSNTSISLRSSGGPLFIRPNCRPLQAKTDVFEASWVVSKPNSTGNKAKKPSSVVRSSVQFNFRAF